MNDYFEIGKQNIIDLTIHLVCEIEGITLEELSQDYENELDSMDLYDLISEYGFYYNMYYNK